MAIYTVVLAAVWQSSGFVMAMFLAGLRGIDNEIIKRRADGRRFELEALSADRHSHAAADISFGLRGAGASGDQILRSRGGADQWRTRTGHGTPATFMYSYTFTRNSMGIGAASATVMLMMIASIIVPYLYSELRPERRT